MDKFTISDLERFSGIKAHTIRIWEQRYNTLLPGRSEGNTRHYDNRQLRRLLNIVSLMDDGKKISELSSLNDEELHKLVEKKLTDANNDSYSSLIYQFVSAIMDYDESYFDKLFANCVLKFGLANTYKFVVLPLLSRIGIMWSGDLLPPSKEHFASNLIRQKFFSAIDALPPADKQKDKWVLFLPEDEYHELGLLFANFLIRQSGHPVIYLGPNVPFNVLPDLIKEVNPHHIYIFFVRRESKKNSQNFLDKLESHFKNQRIHVSGDASVAELVKGRSFHYIKTVEELENMIR